MKILSVIVPVFNLAAPLSKCLESLVDIGDISDCLDVIVVNDGSTDRTGEIAHAFAGRHPGVVRVIDKVNGHYGSCVNAALAVATGTFVRVLDADDYVDTSAFARFLAFLADLRKGELPDAVLTDYATVDAQGRITAAQRFTALPQAGTFAFDDTVALTRTFFQNHALTYRRALLAQIGYRQLEGVPYTDMQWFIVPMCAVRRLRYFPQTVVRYLVGRPGQSVEVTTLIRDMSAFAQVLRTVFAQLVPETFADYAHISPRIRALVVQQLRCLYDSVIFGPYGNAALPVLADFDCYLAREWPALHAEIGGWERSRYLHFRYVREWRRTGGNATCRFRAFRLYERGASCLRRFFMA